MLFVVEQNRGKYSGHRVLGMITLDRFDWPGV